MLVLDREHLAATHARAVKHDGVLRGIAEEMARGSATGGSAAELVRRLREQGDYWERARSGRLRWVKRLLTRLAQPLIKPQIRYNLALAESLGHVEVTLAELRLEIERLRALKNGCIEHGR